VGAGGALILGQKGLSEHCKDVVQKKPKAGTLVPACRLCLVALGNGCSQSVPARVTLGVAAAWEQMMEGKSWQKEAGNCTRG